MKKRKCPKCGEEMKPTAESLIVWWCRLCDYWEREKQPDEKEW